MKKMTDNNIDELLKQALTPADEPDFWLNQNILNQAKETNKMNIRKAGRIPAAAAAAALVIAAGSVSAFAAWKYLTPDKVAESYLKDTALAGAFQGKDAVVVNERQSGGDYNVTLLGIVSGKDLSEYERKSNGRVSRDRTYIVVAIENADGTPMPKTSDDAYADLSFFISPFIRGYDPNWYNVMTMRGNYTEFTENGILYRLLECDNVEIFADRGLYLCVCDGSFYNRKAFVFDEGSGEIKRNEGYEGLNILFDLPIDKSKADPKAAAEYLTSLEESEQGSGTNEDDSGTEEDDSGTEEDDSSAWVTEWMEQVTPENIDQYAQRVESTVMTVTPDADGYVTYEYDVPGRGSGSCTVLVDDDFKKGEKRRISGYSQSGEGLDGVVIDVLELNDEGTVTYAAYIPKES